MNKARKRKLYILLTIVLFVSLVVTLILYALGQNISLFYSPTQISQKEAPLKKNIRVGGMVKEGTVIRNKTNLSVAFEITDFTHSVTIHYQGILPDLFREGQGIVAEGMLMEEGSFKATQILAKHDENYMPPEVKAILPEQKNQKKAVS